MEAFHLETIKRAREAIFNIEKAIEEINKSLPDGITNSVLAKHLDQALTRAKNIVACSTKSLWEDFGKTPEWYDFYGWP